MEFLFSNYPPIRTANKTFADAFYGLIPQTSKLDIAVGYVSSDSLMELKRVVELNNNIHELNLIVGIDCKTWKITSVTVRTTANFTSQKVSTTETFKPPLYCPMCGRLIKIGGTKNEK